MAKAKVFKVWGGGQTYYIPANGIKSTMEAAASVGLPEGSWGGTTVYSKEGETAKAFVERKGGSITTTDPSKNPYDIAPDVPFKQPDVAWTPVGAEPAAPRAPTPLGTTPRIDIDYTRATPVSELQPPTGEERFGAVEAPPTVTPPGAEGYSQEWIENYNAYLDFLKSDAGKNFPVPKDIGDYVSNYEEWQNNWNFYQQGFTQDQIDNYNAFRAFGSKYGNLEDYTPKDLADYLANYDQAQQQLEAWRTEAGPEATGFLDDQIREFYTFKDYQSRYGEPGDWKPVDIGDFFTNYETAQQQLGVWQQQASKVEKYEIEPGEAARRREESYRESRIAAGERYKETPQYQPPFTQWLGEQGQFSGALEQFVESQYPSLRSEFQATQPRLTGFPTPGAARGEAAQREQAWQGWLSGRTPELEQEYWGQRPAQRGERLWMQTPTMRTANW